MTCGIAIVGDAAHAFPPDTGQVSAQVTPFVRRYPPVVHRGGGKHGTSPKWMNSCALLALRRGPQTEHAPSLLTWRAGPFDTAS